MGCGSLRTESVFDSETKVDSTLIEVGPSLEWVVIPVDSDERICIIFYGCSMPSMSAYLLS